MRHKYIEFIKNLGYSFFSFALPTAVLQFVVQPIIANQLGAEENGQYLTLLSLNFFIVGVTATVLNTVRLLQDQKYRENGIAGDFNLIFLMYIVIIVLLMPAGMIYYTKTVNFISIFLYVIIGLLYLYHDYIYAQYRIKLQYNKILISNLILVLGYLIGLLLFMKTLKWYFVYVVSYFLSFVYDYSNTDFIKEPIKKTVLFNETIQILLTLTISNLLSSAITYFDKLLLYPLMGGASVSIYNSAAIVGKMLLMISAPLSSVFLSYLIQENKLKLNFKIKHCILLSVILLGLYVFCVLIGYPLTNLLYPNWSKESQQLIPFVVASSLFLLCGSCMNTILLRFFKTSLQLLIQSIHLLLYIFFSLIGLKLYGLYGFCLGVALSNLIRFIVVGINIIYKPRLFLKQMS